MCRYFWLEWLATSEQKRRWARETVLYSLTHVAETSGECPLAQAERGARHPLNQRAELSASPSESWVQEAQVGLTERHGAQCSHDLAARDTLRPTLARSASCVALKL